MVEHCDALLGQNLLPLTRGMNSKCKALPLERAIVSLETNKTHPSETWIQHYVCPIQPYGRFLERKDHTSEIRNTKRPGRRRETDVVDGWQENLFPRWEKKNPFDFNN